LWKSKSGRKTAEIGGINFPEMYATKPAKEVILRGGLMRE
jgi:hypothetical protein